MLDRTRALVQTVDFFTPIVDDPYAYGQIAAANALSDVYAMGGRPITAMNIVGMPVDRVPPAVIHRILRGGAAKVKEAACALVGGHSIRNPEPIYGLAVTGMVHPKRIITNAGALPGDALVLTKPLGTGIATTAIKRGLASRTLQRTTTLLMSTLNLAGAELGERQFVKAGTDITGFGLLGHLASLCRASGVGAQIDVASVPAISPEIAALIAQGCVPAGTLANLETADPVTDWAEADEAQRLLLADAQTSGGLLLCVPPRRLSAMLDLLGALRTPVRQVIGRITRRGRGERLVRLV